MTLGEVRQILNKYGITTNEYGQPINLEDRILSITAEVYRAIKNMNDPLSDEEHLILFDTFWKRGNEERKGDTRFPNPLKIKFINNRKRISRFDMLAAGHIEGSNIPSLIQECNLSESEEAELWNIFHKSWHHASARDSDEINESLNIYKLIESKLRWKFFGKIRVLDIGCGKNGNGIATLVAKYQGKIKGYGIDLDIQQHPSNVKLFVANAERLPFRDNFFDVIYSCNVIGYFNDKRIVNVIKEVLGVLKPKGVFVFDDYNRRVNIYNENIVPLTSVRAKVLDYKGDILIIKD